MSDALLLVSLMTMFHRTGGVPDKLAEAAYIQLDTQRYVDAIDKRYVPDGLRLFGGKVLLITNLVYRQQINYRIEF